MPNLQNTFMNYAPIILFVYNRPRHTYQSIKALKHNKFALESDLYIYSDAARHTTDEKDVKEVRDYLHMISGFRNIYIIERNLNFGLANSIISGVTEVVQKHDRVIVLEDDIVPQPGFLKYMNEALNLYADEPQVGCIHAWNYNLDIKNYGESTFFLKGADCWGWATWKRAWNEFNPDGQFLLNTIKARNLEYDFNRRNTHDFADMLKDQIDGKNNSWAIRWHASLLVKNMYCLHPTIPIVKNIGFDNSGVHCGESDLEQYPVDHINIQKIPIEESDWFFKSYSAFLKNSKAHLITSKWQKLKTRLKRLFRQ